MSGAETLRFEPMTCAMVHCTNFGCDKDHHARWPDGLGEDDPWFCECPFCGGQTCEVIPDELYAPGACPHCAAECKP